MPDRDPRLDPRPGDVLRFGQPYNRQYIRTARRLKDKFVRELMVQYKDDNVGDPDDEPPCTCRQLDVDQFDSRGCEYHDPGSEWNRERDRQARQVEELEQLVRVDAQEVYQRPAPEDREYEYGRDLGWW